MPVWYAVCSVTNRDGQSEIFTLVLKKYTYIAPWWKIVGWPECYVNVAMEPEKKVSRVELAELNQGQTIFSYLG